ncbi:hypothetical protein evm_005773 [Chilo suppressalis]|nr:hypothetical protein evm_005773 [Chilo suppressalis]
MECSACSRVPSFLKPGIKGSQKRCEEATYRTARCIRIEDEDSDADPPAGYQFSVKLVPDLSTDKLADLLDQLASMLADRAHDDLSVDVNSDVCPEAKMTYLEKCISSVSHHMRSAGYEDNDIVTQRLVQGIREVFR